MEYVEKLGMVHKIITDPSEAKDMFSVSLGSNESMIVYGCGAYIIGLSNGKYSVPITNEEYIFEELTDAEECLWEKWAKYEC